MRTLTAAQQRALELADNSVHVRVRIDRGTNDFVDLSDLSSRNWIESVQYGDTSDSPTVMATIKLFRRSYDLNLSTLNSASKLNESGTIVDIANPVIVEVAVLPKDTLPQSSDWVEVFRGQIEEVDWGTNPITLKCRDQSGDLIDNFIEVQRVYPKVSGSNDNQMEDVIQDIVDDNSPALFDGAGAYTWDGTTTVLVTNTGDLAVGDYIGNVGGTAVSAFFEIQSITPNTSVVISNPQSRTIPDFDPTTFTSQVIPAADRVTLYSPSGTSGTPFSDPTNFTLNSYKQSKESLHTAIRRIAVLIGYDLKYKWHDNTSAFQLQLFPPVRAVAAQGTLTLTGTMSDGDSFVVNATTFTARTSPTTDDEFLIGATAAGTVANIVSTFNGTGSERANAFSHVNPTDSTKAIFSWGTLGTAGNSITFTESSADATADGGGVLGGTRSGSDGQTSPDFTFASDRYFDVKALKITRQDIRNAIHLVFTDSSNSRQTTVVRKDTASIVKYGRRYMELTEASTSQIDTFSEALDLADAAMADLREPDAIQTIDHPFFWPAEPMDLYRYTANGDHYDTDQDLAVVSISHSLPSNGRPATSITVRGKPAGGIKRWLELQGRPGLNPPIDEFSDSAATGTTITPGVGSITVQYDDPRTFSPPIDDWTTTRVHVNLGAGDFTASAANLAAEGRQTRFDITGLIPGQTYAIKVRVIDGAGNVGSVTTFVDQATERSGPFHENNERDFGTVNPNPSFGIFTKDQTTTPPDYWEVDLGSWANSIRNFYFETTIQRSGDTSIKYGGGVKPGSDIESRFISDFILVEEDSLYVVAFTWQHDGDTGNKTHWTIDLAGFEKDKTTSTAPVLRNTLLTYGVGSAGTDPTTASTWVCDRGWVKTPTNTRYLRARLRVVTGPTKPSAQANHPTIYWDNVSIQRAPAKLIAEISSGADRTIAANTWVAPWLTTSGYFVDNVQGFTAGFSGGPVEHQYVVPFTGEYEITGIVGLNDLTAGKHVIAKIVLDPAGSPSDLIIGPPTNHPGSAAGMGQPRAVVKSSISMTAGDVIRLEGRHNDTVSRTIDDSECLLSVIQQTNATR